MKVLVVIAALVAVAYSAPSAIIGPVGPGAVVRGSQAVLAGPSGTVIADTGAIVSGGAHPASVIAAAPAVNTIVSSGLVGHGLVGHGLVGHGLVSPGLVGVHSGLVGVHGGLVGLHGGLVGLGGHGLILG